MTIRYQRYVFKCVSVKIYRRVFMGTHMMFFSVNISKHLVERACDVC